MTGSVRRKVIVIILITSFVALLVSMVALLSYEAQAYRSFLINDLTTQAEILAVNSVPALAFNDPDAAQTNVDLLGNRTGITAAAIYTKDGGLFASYRSGEYTGALPERGELREPVVEGSALKLFHPIVNNGVTLGTVYLQASYALGGRIADYLLILGATMAASLAVAALLSLWLQRSVTAPISAVTGIAQKIVDERNFNLRASRTTDDEIGTLVDAFNAMLGEVGERQRDLEATNEKLKAESDERRKAEDALRLANQRKDEFLATLAHELRNPLAPMVNSLALLELPGTPPETGRRARGIIERQLSHMVRLIEDLLDVSRISQGKLTIHREQVDLALVLRNAIDTVRPLLEAKDQQLIAGLPQTPVYLQGDAVRLSQVFSNLLNNASKYTADGGRIGIATAIADGRAEVTVSDNGRGITPATLDVMFEMFVQDASADQRGQAGLGVGLALAKRLVEMHGGEIRAASEGCGKGSTFTVTMPVDVAAALPAAEEGKRREFAGRERYRILLVDDNVDFATTMAMLLRNLGHEVAVAHDAPEALAAAVPFRPDFAFLDIGLPTMDGYELARKLSDTLAHSQARNVKLVAISGWGQKEDRRRADAAGFGWYLVKPVDLDSIRAILDALPAVSAEPVAPRARI
ncbi:MAG TPA: ATP-binding protein [Woeseiaceae bacterium]|nr:ATP-binding protein [Woeseiaceae bacterium]